MIFFDTRFVSLPICRVYPHFKFTDYLASKYVSSEKPSELNEMNRLPPIQGQSTLKQLETIANEADQSAAVNSADQSASLTADQSVPEKKPRRRRRKKKPDQSQSAVEINQPEVNHELPAISAGQFNPQPEINPQPQPNPPSEPYKPVDWNMRMLEEQQRINQIDTVLGASVVPVRCHLRPWVKNRTLGAKSRPVEESRKAASG